MRYGPSYGNGHASDDRGVQCRQSRDGDKFHRADMACEYTVLPQEMTSSYGRAGGCCRSDATGDRRAGGGVPADDEETAGGGRWYSCSCRRLTPVSVPRPPDSIAYLSGTIDHQPGSWRRDDDDTDDDGHRHCTCTSGRCRQPTPALRRTFETDPRRRQLACYVIASTSDEDGDESAAATAPPDVQTVAPSVPLAQH